MMLGEKIKQFRVEHNLTQEELASKLFVTRNAVSKWENNNGYPCIDTLKDIAKLLNVTIDELLCENDAEEVKENYSGKYNKNKKYVYSGITFISYCFVAVLIPHIMFALDPTSVMAYCLFIGPLSFIILGLITPLYNSNMLYSLVAAALAITPILIYFEISTKVVIAGWEIFYYLLFVGSYCLMLKMMKINLKENKHRVLKWISFSFMVFFSFVYLVLSVISLVTYNESHSSPIYTGIIVYTIYFIIPILLSFLVYKINAIKIKKL